MTNDEWLEQARALAARGADYALVTVVRAVAPTSAYVGAHALVLADGTLHGWIGGGCAQGAVVAAARRAIASGEAKLVRISNEQVHTADDDVERYTMACASNGTVEVFIQPSTRSALCVLGGTPAADEARLLAQRLNIKLVDTPSEAPVVLVATQGQGDEDALDAALRSPARQVLMIASRRKAAALRDAMRARGLNDAQLARLQAPAGPDAGAKTPAEIAMVALVGVLAWLRGRTAVREAQPEAPAPGHAPAAGPVAPLPPSGPPGSEGAFINPVCGMAVAPATAMHVERYEGVDYYFCCDGCRATFLGDPARFAAIHRARGEGLPAR